MFAGIIFKKDTFFTGSNNNDQLVKIVEVLGTTDLFTWLRELEVILGYQLICQLGRHPRKLWESFRNSENSNLANDHALELLNGLLQFNHMTRLTAKEAMALPYFDSVRAERSDRDHN